METWTKLYYMSIIEFLIRNFTSWIYRQINQISMLKINFIVISVSLFVYYVVRSERGWD